MTGRGLSARILTASLPSTMQSVRMRPRSPCTHLVVPQARGRSRMADTSVRFGMTPLFRWWPCSGNGLDPGDVPALPNEGRRRG